MREFHERLATFLKDPLNFIIPRGSALYPQALERLPDPPEHIFGRGNVSLLGLKKICVVGTRKATPLGRARTIMWVRAWIRAPFHCVVVSGLASGVDQWAHEASLPQTIAVLAFGHDFHYPPENQWLRHKIESEGGLSLSAYPPWERPRKHYFLERNTIMAALCKRVVVIEAPLQSGALYTARTASELDGEVYAVPGNPEQIHYQGNLRLIQEGAWPLAHHAEITTDAI